jgi:leucyl aminopeptidase
MADSPVTAALSGGVFLDPESPVATVPIWLVSEQQGLEGIPGLESSQREWLRATGFSGAVKKQALVPAGEGRVGGVVLGVGNGANGEPCGPSELLLGQLAASLPEGAYHLATPLGDPTAAAVAWGLGAYRFQRYKEKPAASRALLKLPASVDRREVEAVVEGVWLGRDLINTPASDLGPAELEEAVRALAQRHGAAVRSITGEALLAEGFPLIHAVGRASTRAPRLIDLTWGAPAAPRVTLVGKGICFDTGGLDIKPASGMLLMKKDMGGAAAALATGHMVMSLRLPVRLRILIPAADNSISGDAFRPGDVLRSRAGKTVEIGNTDAEGRLVLADALALADEERPAVLVSLATLTGAARVALGPDLPPLYCDDEAFSSELIQAGARIGDPVWRMPLWTGYERYLDSEVADMNNVSESPFAGSVTAALFLRRFVRAAKTFAHLDIYGWRPAARPLGPKGGEPQAARALFEVLRARYG